MSKGGDQLQICQTNLQDNPLMVQGAASQGAIPIIGLCIWEHAYWEEHNGDKLAYLEQFWNVIIWSRVSHNFEAFNLKGQVGPILE